MTGPARPPAAPRCKLAARWRALVSIWPALLPPLLFIPVILAPPLTADGGVTLDTAQRWLAGARLYVDVIDVNPPLIFVLNLVPAALARLTGVDAVAALQFCLIALSFWLWRLAVLVRDRAAEAPIERLTLDVLPGLMSFGAGYLYGERGALMVAAALPYLLAAARRRAGAVPRGWLVTAVVAALGFALKPYFLVIPLAVELALAAGRGWRPAVRDPVPRVMLLLWLGYAASLPLAFPAYVDTIVPWAWRYYVGSGPLTPLGMLLLPRVALPVLALLPLAWLAFRRTGEVLARLLALAAFGALAAAIAQHKGWGPHVIPLHLFTCALAAVLAARWLDRAEVWRQAHGTIRAAGMISALFAAICVQAGRAPLVELHYAGSDDARLTRLLTRYAAGGSAMALSPGMPLAPAINYARVPLAQRTMLMWILQGSYASCPADGPRYRAPSAMGDAERSVYHGVPEDFAAARPALVLVDTSTGIPDCGGRFSYLAYFQRNPLFAAAWREYRLAEAWGRFQIYVRK
jgi:hypothetical protein